MDETPEAGRKVRHKLAPAAISFDRAVGWMTAVSISIPLLLALPIGYWATSYPAWLYVLAVVLWVAITAWLVWLAEVWPRRSYEATSYVVDQVGVEIWRGVHWRAIIAVPRSRVQHIDVLQGPLRRRFGLAALVIFTAGTEHSTVRLDNLEHQVALDLRDQLLPQASDDGI
ncbi:MAG: PH domain-containing protein [Acidobacteriota bacterium]|jgi:membrane protein YdbS with pleckstrin-like domain|nr:PH domain-containing protein [Acidobacteriota bacterium]MDQ3418576.1 PH domain-containing protein [Acidobacteriota bacterium]